MSLRVAVCVSGRGSNLVALVDALSQQPGPMVALVISNRPTAGALDYARSAAIPAVVLADPTNPAEWLLKLADASIDFIVLAGFLKQVPAEVVRRYAGRIINVHPALLPKFGGPGMYGTHVHHAVLAAGERESGATVHIVSEQYDEGPILAQARVPVLPDDTPETLAKRVLEQEHRLLPAAVRAAAATGRAVPFTFTSETT